MLFYVAFLHSEDSYSAIVAQLPEKQEYLWYSDERVMKELFYVHEVLMPPPRASGEIMKAYPLKLI